MKDIFPYSDVLNIVDRDYSYTEVINVLGRQLSPQRVAKIESVAAGRLIGTNIVTERIHDIGNVNAVMRSAESLGFMSMDLIESEQVKFSTRITQGAHKWLHINRHKSTLPCIEGLKNKGFQIVSTRLSERAKPLDEIDFSRPTAIVFGNEKHGVSPEMVEHSDHDCIIPMSGFSQSFNISVAAAIVLYHIKLKYSDSFKLSKKQIDIIKAHYMLQTCKSPHLYFK